MKTTVGAMYFLGLSINTMSMIGLTMTIGILVDDSIVVLENIFRHLRLGETPTEAALNGRSEIAADTRGRLTLVEFLNPAGFAPPLHRHRDEDELFYILSGRATFRCDGHELQAAPGDVVFLPAGLPHAFLVGQDEPLRVLQITTPAGFEAFAAAAGEPAQARRLPEPGPVDPAVLARIAAEHGVEILGPPPTA